MNFADLPAIGQPLDAGIFAGVTTTPAGDHCAAGATAWDAAWDAAISAPAAALAEDFRRLVDGDAA